MLFRALEGFDGRPDHDDRPLRQESDMSGIAADLPDRAPWPSQRPPACEPWILGVDPGLSGALGFYCSARPDQAAAEDMPVAGGEIDPVTLARRIAQRRPVVAVVERVSARPKQGVASTFKFGAAYGAVRGVLGALQVPVHLVTPGLWKRHYHLRSDKEDARALALRLFPATSACFHRRKDHGRAEAALIARYGAEVLLRDGRA
jgi:crossover junction endodeoxyribonuclease RuvC